MSPSRSGKGRAWQTQLKELRRHGDFVTLMLLAIVVGCLWGFIELADELREGGLREIDTWLLHLLRDPANPANPLGPRWLQELVRDLSALGSFPVLFLLSSAVVAALWMEKHRTAAIWLTVAVLGALAMNTVGKLLFARQRPDILPVELLPGSFSFPSGHAFMSAAVYFTIAALLTRVVPKRRTRTFVLVMAMLLTVLTGFSRVYLGVHYPSDVLAGWTLGLCWAALCWLIVWNLQKS